MTQKTGEEPRKRDWRISAVLLAIWLAALVVMSRGESHIPLSMLAIGTVFFVMLIPAMNDLVSSIDRFFDKSEQTTEEGNKDRN